MTLKVFRRETVKDALRAVREELGPDALVLSTRLVPAPGIRGWLRQRDIEVTAAAERIAVSEGRHPAPRGAAAVQAIVARLRAGGLDEAFARDVAAAMPADARRAATPGAVHDALAQELAPLAAIDETFAAIEVFVGPPGVGKTTTIAKIAAQQRARHNRKVGMVAADGFRVGAIEQLRQYATIIGVPFAAARSGDELERALLGARRPVLLDTAGRSPNDTAAKAMYAVLGRRSDVRTHLVLPATATASAARKAIERFADARPSRLVLTRLDESETIAPILNALRDLALPVSYLGTGQSVPEDLQRATASTLAAWATGDGATLGALAS